MSEPLPVRIVSSAARSIAEVAAWWAENRPIAPDTFVDDLERSNANCLTSGHRRKRPKREIRKCASCSLGSCSLLPLLPSNQ